MSTQAVTAATTCSLTRSDVQPTSAVAAHCIHPPTRHVACSTSSGARGIDYLLTPPTVVAADASAGAASTGAGTAGAEEPASALIYVCDTSGSMCSE